MAATGTPAATAADSYPAASRSGTLASDWYFLGRVRRIEEVHQAIDGLTPRSIVEHVRRRPPEDFTIVTLGAESLKVH